MADEEVTSFLLDVPRTRATLRASRVIADTADKPLKPASLTLLLFFSFTTPFPPPSRPLLPPF